MKRFAAILALVTALCIGWVPVFAAPARLAGEMGLHHQPDSGLSQHADHIGQSRPCGEPGHCSASGALHPAVCSACIGAPMATALVSIAEKPRIIIPRGQAMPLVAGILAPLPRPPRC